MMKVVVCSITIGFSFVCTEMITYHLSRNPQYDEKQTHPTNILTISKFRSLLHCATFCRSKDNCRSLLYNADNLFCELLSVHLASENILGEQGSRGWKYYELNNDSSLWHSFQGHMYMLDDRKRDFTFSKEFCESLSTGSYITEVDSQAENDWLAEFAASYQSVVTEFWLNGHDMDNSGRITWLNDGGTANYTNWGIDQPSAAGELCIAMSTAASGTWNDVLCTTSRPVICERNA
ncbi:perlucin-like protein [Ostrea edulis]|uniref:perlucin-like protein n=1 Tax=Ostrea edulis TaxID=37623 RepID=UPI002095C4B4|nr:perlucin-like protein [Ostrea edulis]